jgi:hypothetical protein
MGKAQALLQHQQHASMQSDGVPKNQANQRHALHSLDAKDAVRDGRERVTDQVQPAARQTAAREKGAKHAASAPSKTTDWLVAAGGVHSSNKQITSTDLRPVRAEMLSGRDAR